MAKKKTSRRKTPIRKIRPLFTSCPFCKEKRVPDYKNSDELSKYLTDRAKIMAKERTGLCAKHQRRLAVAIKRARHLGLLPFTGSL